VDDDKMSLHTSHANNNGLLLHASERILFRVRDFSGPQSVGAFSGDEKKVMA
jgi:hypothetical protein